MRRPFILQTCVLWLCAAPVRAQDAAPSAAATPEEIAAKTMTAMEALAAPAETDSKPIPGKINPNKSTKPVRKAAAGKPEKEEEETAAPTLLPPGARGVDPMSRARMDLMIPTGRSHKGVHYPMYRPVESGSDDPDLPLGSAGGVVAPLASLFESDIVTRLDEDHVQFDHAKWVQFGAQPTAGGAAKPTMTLEIERGVYDLKSEILMTNQPVKIENQQFLITGDTMLHDRASGLTRLTGRVKMTFYNEEPDPLPSKEEPVPTSSTNETPGKP